MLFNWKAFGQKLLDTLPNIIQDIENIHGDSKSGASKTQLAVEAALDAGQVAGTVDSDPKSAADIQAATVMAATVVEALQTPPPAPNSTIGESGTASAVVASK